MSRLLRVVPSVLLVVLAVVGLAACGGDDDSGAGSGEPRSAAATTARPVALVADAFSDKRTVTSGKVDLKLRVDAKGAEGLDGPLSLRLRGPFAAGDARALPRFDLAASIDTGAIKVSAGAVSTGGRIWVRYGGTAYVLPSSLVKQARDAYRKAEGDKRGSQPTLSSLGIDPSEWLEDATVVGDETVAGEAATHVRADVDVDDVLDDVSELLTQAGSSVPAITLSGTATAKPTTSPKLSAKDRRAVEQAITEATIDVWTGKDDGLLRRLRIALSFDVPADDRERADGLSSGSIALDVTMTDLNEDQTITAPARARPFSELQPLLSGVLAL